MRTDTCTNVTGVKAIACGSQFDVALLTNGTVTAWSSNNPTLNTAITNVPADLSNVIAIAAGATHTLALQANGIVTGHFKTGHLRALSNQPDNFHNFKRQS